MVDDSFLVLLNAHSEPVRFTMPEELADLEWEIMLYSAMGLAAPLPVESPETGDVGGVVRGVAQKEEWTDRMKILFATAEYAPLVRVGGLGEAAAGLVTALRGDGVDVEVVLPDYFSTPLEDETSLELDVPAWVGGARARSGIDDGAGEVTLVEVPGINRPNPYVDADGSGWPDNADRFFAFSAAVAALATGRRPDVLHCNDWHTAVALGFVDDALPYRPDDPHSWVSGVDVGWVARSNS